MYCAMCVTLKDVEVVCVAFAYVCACVRLLHLCMHVCVYVYPIG